MSAAFWFIAGVLAGVTAAAVAIPLWRPSLRVLERTPLRYAIPAGAIATFAVAAAVIYLTIGSPRAVNVSATSVIPMQTSTKPQMSGAGQSMEAAAAGLAARLARDGGSADDWNLLAQSYDFLGRADDARRARARAASAPGSKGALAPAAATLSPTTAAIVANQMTSARQPAESEASSTVADLERRLRSNPGDTQALLDLAGLQRRHHDYAQARDTFAKLIRLNAMTAPAWADEADVLASLAGGSLGGEAGRAIDRALALDPANSKALWLQASPAHEERRYSDALGLWKTLRALLPADSPDVRVVDANILEAGQLAGAPNTQIARTDVPSPAAIAVTGTVSIDSRLASRVERDATLFIYAKAVDSPGPPLAVLRTTAGTWPVSFRLDDSMALIPSRRLSQFDKVVVEARVSRTGQATPATGDLYVTSAIVKPAPGKKIALIINREIG